MQVDKAKSIESIQFQKIPIDQKVSLMLDNQEIAQTYSFTFIHENELFESINVSKSTHFKEAYKTCLNHYKTLDKTSEEEVFTENCLQNSAKHFYRQYIEFMENKADELFLKCMKQDYEAITKEKFYNLTFKPSHQNEVSLF
jgi:tRNA C32,U32 (ribose-2'-O)-methylase TrmJ